MKRKLLPVFLSFALLANGSLTAFAADPVADAVTESDVQTTVSEDQENQEEVTVPEGAILVKSALLAGTAGYAARRFNRVSVALLAAVVLFYQIVGSAGEWALTGSFTAAVQDFRIGIPGMLLQVFGGYLFIKYVIRK